MSTDTAQSEWKAPYIAYSTLVNFIDQKCGANPLPPRIDRSFLDNYSGSVQPLLLGTLRTVGLIGEDNQVLQPLRDAARSPQARKGVLREWAEGFYKEQLGLAEEHATTDMLQHSFARHKYTGSTLRKAVVFFLSLTDDLGLPKSPHFKPPRQLAGQARPRTRRVSPPPPEAAAPTSGDVREPDKWDTLTVHLKSGGTVTLMVDVNPLMLKGEERKFFYTLVDHLDGYQQAAASSDAQSTPSDGLEDVE
jgi:hypothetical protein